MSNKIKEVTERQLSIITGVEDVGKDLGFILFFKFVLFSDKNMEVDHWFSKGNIASLIEISLQY